MALLEELHDGGVLRGLAQKEYISKCEPLIHQVVIRNLVCVTEKSKAAGSNGNHITPLCTEG